MSARVSSVLETTTAAVLAGGYGTRVQGALGGQPKALAPIHGRPMLAYVLEALERAGLRRAVLCLGYQGALVAKAMGRGYGAMRLDVSQEDAPLGTGGALQWARGLLTTEPVLICNGDSFCDADLGAFLAWHRQRDSRGSVVLTQAADAGRYGRVEVDEQGRILAFREKPPAGQPGWINAGLYLLSQELLASIPSGRAVSIEREVLPQWVGQGLFGWKGGGRFLDIGTPEDYRQAEAFFQPPAAVSAGRS